ncbi:hypothetical protein [Amycolatopsis sp. WAC 04182]|nr:hypothetical protein [Amycolatopsis sp. WAC 04182]
MGILAWIVLGLGIAGALPPLTNHAISGGFLTFMPRRNVHR